MTEIGYYSILFSLFFSAFCGIALILGIKNRWAEVIASAENAAIAVFVFLKNVKLVFSEIILLQYHPHSLMQNLRQK